MRSLVIGIVVVLWGMILSSCGFDIGEISPKSEERVFQDGRIYILNNIRPFPPGSYYKALFIMYEGQRIDIPLNMTTDGEPTWAGAMQITPDPLPGGTTVDFDYTLISGTYLTRKLSSLTGGPVTIDGDITIEFYEQNWDIMVDLALKVRVLPGKQDSIHEYK